MIVLGLSAFYHDSAAALVRDGEIIAAAQEERFTRKKHDAGFPEHAVRFCLDQAGISLDQVDHVGFYDKPLLTFNRLLETYIGFAPRGLTSFARSIPVWVREKVLQKELIHKGLNALGRGAIDPDQLLFGFHHHSHAASAFFPSPFERAAILVMDGVGEWATTTIGRGDGGRIELLSELRFPHSLGLLYSAFTYYLGFAVNEGEYKVMGLAPYGEPTEVETIKRHLIDIKEDGSFRLDQRYFNYCTGLTMTNRRFADLFGGPARAAGESLTQRHMDLARSLQAVTEEIVLKLAATARRITGETNLVLAGGVALNCVANGRLLREGPFDRIWVQPAAGDAGAALGVALSITHEVAGVPRTVEGGDTMKGAQLGPAFDRDAVISALTARGAVFEEMDDDSLFPAVAHALAGEKVVGWFQGRMEFGPRALGNRSILGDARSPRMQSILNLKIKYRESFRPFAPIVRRERAADYFDIDTESPYMLIVAPVRAERRVDPGPDDAKLFGIDKLKLARSDIPAVTHVDHSARIQTVDPQRAPRLYRLLQAFEGETGEALLVNTSFNVRDEPIVCTPDDAWRCFMGTEMDMLVLGNIVLRKEAQA
jgi:carbamoyltransferase